MKRRRIAGATRPPSGGEGGGKNEGQAERGREREPDLEGRITPPRSGKDLAPHGGRWGGQNPPQQNNGGGGLHNFQLCLAEAGHPWWHAACGFFAGGMPPGACSIKRLYAIRRPERPPPWCLRGGSFDSFGFRIRSGALVHRAERMTTGGAERP